MDLYSDSNGGDIQDHYDDFSDRKPSAIRDQPSANLLEPEDSSVE